MQKWIVTLGTCAALSALPMGALAHGYDAGDAALGGLVGGVVGGLIGSVIAPYPVYAAPAPVVVERYVPPPVVVEEYAPAPVVVERYGPPVVLYGPRTRYWHRHHRHDDD
jgi:hypothetical protein